MSTSSFASPLGAHQLVSLNIWGGHVRQPLLDFIRNHQDVSIFCLQEVYHEAPHAISTEDRVVALNIFSELQDCLPEHAGYFVPVVGSVYGIGMFIRKDIKVISHGETTIHENPKYEGRGPTHERRLQWARCQSRGDTFYVLNVHGLWNGQGKGDSPARIAQSKKIREVMDSLEHPIILCGDFNLNPQTESLQIISSGLKNMIALHNVSSTRTRFYPKEEKFADYIMTSPDLLVHVFRVLPDEVSDHAPLYLDFDLPRKEGK